MSNRTGHALLELLAYEVGGGPDDAHLLRSSACTTVRVRAEWAPFDMKDVQGARRPLVRRRRRTAQGLVDEDDLAAELRVLEREVYLREVELRRDVRTAYGRYRPD